MTSDNFNSTQLLTEQQIAIIRSSGNLRINAVAGSGKTTTIVEYAASRPNNPKILYLAFNKSVKLEAARKFEARGLKNVKVETAHSLAYKNIVFKYNYAIKTQGYKIGEIAEFLGLKGNGEKHAQFVIANHINKFFTYFCNSDKTEIQNLNYLDTIIDNEAKAFVNSFYSIIENGTQALYNKMNNHEIDITHDFYLKKFQLSNPKLFYDYILFDEAQDASAAMLDVIMKQNAIKIIVGDVHQQIYGWRHAVNSLDKTDFDVLHLSTSFRFGQDLANLASDILNWKNHLSETKRVSITGKGEIGNNVFKATIARTNLGLLLNAIDFITDNPQIKHIYFEGNIHSYTYADDGTSLYDVLNLYNGNFDKISDKLVRSMKDLDELEEYIEKTEDVQLATMVEIVREYGNEIHGIIKKLKSLHISDEERQKAEMIFSTVHRSKGMEYDIVYLVNDFISEAKLKELKEKRNNGFEVLNINRLNEEINLLYVAVTRSRSQLYIPETLLSEGFSPSPCIHKVEVPKDIEEDDNYLTKNKASTLKSSFSNKKQIAEPKKEKAYTVLQKRETHKDAYKPWTQEQDEELKEFFKNGMSISQLTAYFNRTKGAIISRLKKLGYYGD